MIVCWGPACCDSSTCTCTCICRRYGQRPASGHRLVSGERGGPSPAEAAEQGAVRGCLAFVYQQRDEIAWLKGDSNATVLPAIILFIAQLVTSVVRDLTGCMELVVLTSDL